MNETQAGKWDKPVEVMFQQTGPKEGVWVLAEKWKEYIGVKENVP